MSHRTCYSRRGLTPLGCGPSGSCRRPLLLPPLPPLLLCAEPARALQQRSTSMRMLKLIGWSNGTEMGSLAWRHAPAHDGRAHQRVLSCAAQQLSSWATAHAAQEHAARSACETSGSHPCSPLLPPLPPVPPLPPAAVVSSGCCCCCCCCACMAASPPLPKSGASAIAAAAAAREGGGGIGDGDSRCCGSNAAASSRS